jgi:hypothetical protein
MMEWPEESRQVIASTEPASTKAPNKRNRDPNARMIHFLEFWGPDGSVPSHTTEWQSRLKAPLGFS